MNSKNKPFNVQIPLSKEFVKIKLKDKYDKLKKH